MTAPMTQPAAIIAMLAGDPVTAERYLRLEYGSLYEMGERHFLSSTAAELARAIAAQGPSRYDEAIQLLDMSRNEHANTLLELSHVLAAAGQVPEAGARESLRHPTQSAPT